MDKNTATGVICLNRTRQIFGKKLPDPFFDDFKEEVLECTDIMNRIAESNGKISLTFATPFLKKIVHSHILYIRRLEGDLNGRTYEH